MDIKHKLYLLPTPAAAAAAPPTNFIPLGRVGYMNQIMLICSVN